MINILIEAALRSTVVLGIAWLVTAVLRRISSDVRVRIWRTALAATVLLLIPVRVPEPVRILSTALADAAGVPSGLTGSVPILAAIWISVLALLMGRLAFRLAALIRLTHSASTCLDLNVRVSCAVMTPITWGVLHPVILMPAYVLDWPAEKYTALIRHEKAHIERQDWAWQIFAECVTAVFWFHPLVWLAAARLRSEAEHAADDRVLAGGAEASDYARQLVEIARRVNQLPPQIAVAMIRRPKALQSRVEAILDSSRARAGAGPRTRLMVVLAGAGVLLFLVACQSARLYKVTQLQTPPKVVSKVEPAYTEEARQAKIQGPVVLSLEIDSHGLPRNISVTKSLDKGLDEQAIVAVEKRRFSPGVKDGMPVRAAAIIEVNFHLSARLKRPQ